MTQDIQCKGTESSLLNCILRGGGGNGEETCSHSDDVGVACEGKTIDNTNYIDYVDTGTFKLFY